MTDTAAEPAGPRVDAPRTAGLTGAFVALPTTQRVLESIRPHNHRAVGGLWGSSSALLIAALAENANGRPLLVVTATDEDSAQLDADLATFTTADVHVLPTQLVDADGHLEPISQGARARCLSEVSTARRFVLLASLEAMLQPAPSVELLRQGRVKLRVGTRHRQDEFVSSCQEAELREVPVVLAPGEFSPRGDVVDVFPLAATEAVRIEFFDDEIDSIRTFDPVSQRSLAVLDEVSVVLGGKVHQTASEEHVLSHVFRTDLLACWFEPLRIDERKQQLAGFDNVRRGALVQLTETLAPCPWLELSSLPSQDIDYKVLSAGSAVGSGENDPIGRLRSIRGARGAVHVVCRSDSERQRLRDIFARKELDLATEQVVVEVGTLSRGFRVPDLGVTVVSNVEFAGVPAPTRVKERVAIPSKAVRSFFELGPGDLVVHAVHGIAKFESIERIERGESAEDHLRLVFHDDVRLLVPVSKIHLVQKYVGAGQASPKLDKLGGRGYAKRKQEVQDSLFDLASDLLEVQAKREKTTRPPYPADELEQDFLDAFPFEDTEDQKTCWGEIRTDLEKPHPMDRLLCGDVGFGKTELALRAAFRVAITGRQVAVLVPTTVLADQHGETFGKRFEPFGLRVEVLSRFKTGKAKTKVLDDLAAGRVDVVVGTQRILSDDVAFQDLGLLVVDEEQRFGVRQKEQLKALRIAVDVLTLSATPIPRTLHAGLLGIRAISTLSTPPAGRQDVETRVAYRDDHLLREALTHELAREGQTFVLHNRIDGLEPLQQLIEQLVPGIRVAIGHGKMTAAQMEKTLRTFVQGKADVLVCTTIVENGLDIPNANTILVDRAEMFGLAELHQLRGRVGRSSRKAYCWLLMDRLRPPGNDGRRRLKALEELSNLGAGFAIAMKDLEIRGAGNILGPQQSGHIAAIGYEMYSQLLRTAVERAKAGADGAGAIDHVVEVDVDLQLQAFLPDRFAPDAKERLELLRELDDAMTLDSARAIRDDLRDRFGKLPKPVENLLGVFLLKHALMGHGVLGVQRTGPDRVVVRHPPGTPLGGAWLDAFAATRPVEAGKTHLLLPPGKRGGKASYSGEQTLGFMLEALCGERL